MIYSHYNLEQEILNKDFIIMNQKSKEKPTNNVEKEFSKLLHNSTKATFVESICTYAFFSLFAMRQARYHI